MIKEISETDDTSGEKLGKESLLIKEDSKKVQDEQVKEKIASLISETKKELKEDASVLPSLTDKSVVESIKVEKDEMRLEMMTSSSVVKSPLDVSTVVLDELPVRKSSMEAKT